MCVGTVTEMRNLFAVFYVAYYEYFVLIHIIIAGIIFHSCSFAPNYIKHNGRQFLFRQALFLQALFRQALFRQFLFRHAIIHDIILCIM